MITREKKLHFGHCGFQNTINVYDYNICLVLLIGLYEFLILCNRPGVSLATIWLHFPPLVIPEIATLIFAGVSFVQVLMKSNMAAWRHKGGSHALTQHHVSHSNLIGR